MTNIADFNLHSCLRTMLHTLGEDQSRPGIVETPDRAARAWRYWTSGYTVKPEDVLKLFEDGSENYDSLVFQGNIPVYSHCEHHMAPFFGVAHVGYVPNGKILGLSKFSRLVDIYARRFQVQERLTCQIGEALMTHLKPKAVGVVLRCRHLCMESRGVQRTNTVTYTSELLGGFRDHGPARAEFLQFVERADGKV